MRRHLRLAAALLAIMALALIGAMAAAADNPQVSYTCTKVKKKGDAEVRTSVPESAVSGLTNAGFTCVADAVEEETDDETQPEDTQEEPSGGDEEDPSEETQDEQSSSDGDGPSDETQDEQSSSDGDGPSDETQDEQSAGDEDETQDESEQQDSTPGPETKPKGGTHHVTAVEAPSESRSLYCSASGPAAQSSVEPGVALNLLSSQGAELVERGVVTPAIYYAGIGASCDVLPGFQYSGVWVDNVGDVVAGVAVYPYFVKTAS